MSYFKFDNSGFFSSAKEARYALVNFLGWKQEDADTLGDEEVIDMRCEVGYNSIPEPERTAALERMHYHRKLTEEAISLNYLDEIVEGFVYGVAFDGSPSRLNVSTMVTDTSIKTTMGYKGDFSKNISDYVRSKGYRREETKVIHSTSMQAVLYDYKNEVIPFYYNLNTWGAPQLKKGV